MKVESSDGSTLSSSKKELERDEAFIERLRSLAEYHGSVNALAKAAGVSQSGLQRYLNGGEPSRKALIAIALASDVSLGWLATGEGDKQESGQEEVAGMEDYAFVPLYDAQCSAGDGAWNENCRVLTHISFTRYSLRKQGLTPEHLSAIRIDGDSMEPILHSGDTVLIDHTRTTIEGEGIYILRLDGHLYAKRLQRNFDGVSIISTNKEYREVVVPRDRLHELDIIGRAVWSAGWL
ncbi:Phage repressor protein C, contains Cro/C1-type HTH and peptisase s24 domains [Vreelandella subterranea]|uniref:Phage repressor protein C, contains Cro/C1-type HTH and peptisase s24 domains n=1 Tax=Vreelandella subterranea TaxID=416874 RepID=A0A1H9VS33_9GAMM|nr:Phage repressor protein C, contains Cro/C1-type HTH and peptisase s24 domains [Halomonas subterranea]